jgi:GH15 family glucan-1,4-alpha-glucosidase
MSESPSRVVAARTGESPPHVLREYALVADGERGVLIGPRGELAWMCFPRWDSDAIFAGLVGGGGTYALTPCERFVWGGYYEPGTLIWRSRWVTTEGVIECREALAVPPKADRAVVLRRIVARDGAARVDIVLEPRTGFGEAPLRDVRRDDAGVWTARTGDVHVRWTGAAEARVDRDGALTLRIEVPEGGTHDLVLELGTGPASDAVDPDRAWRQAETHWERRIPKIEAAGEAERDARHAYAVLDGLTSSGGGMVAAASMSLPERAIEGRSYDYRYVWIRDQCYAGQAVATAGAFALLGEAVRFVSERLLEHGSQLAPAYTTTADAVPGERRLDLPGYPGGTDIVGNWINEQFQLDAFGEALLLFAAAAAHDHLDAQAWRAAEIAADAIAARRHEPDAGIWELDPDRWTHSRLICSAGLRRISSHATSSEQGARWLALADSILAEAAAEALHPSGRWQRSPGDPRPDAALLLAALRGAVPAEDPRSQATLAAVERELTQDGYCYRYRPDELPLGEAEGAFLLCGFWLALAHLQAGDHVTAARRFERNRAACGPPGLLSEEFDVRQRQLRGNLPQAFVHALCLETAVALTERA